MQDDRERDQYVLCAQPVVRGTQQPRIETAIKQEECSVMRKAFAVAVALLAGALASDYTTFASGGGQVLAADNLQAAGADSVTCRTRRAPTSDWIRLHRPDGEIVHIKSDQIVFVTSAAATAADKRARSKLQLLNGFSDVRESVEEVMQAVAPGISKQISNM
jgi:hypothetical protein